MPWWIHLNARADRRRVRGAILALMLLAGVTAPSAAETLVPVARAAAVPQFDAALTDAAWSSASRVSQFTDVAQRTAPRSHTEAAVYYDDANVYVAFWCSQEAPLTATQRTNNAGFGSDDFVGIGIDPAGNGERTYYFEVTPLGTRYAQASEDTRYVPNWSARVLKTAGGWSAMLVIPLRAMRLSASGEQTWRINLVRSVVASGERLSSSYNGQMNGGSGFPDLADARYWLRSAPLRISTAAARQKPAISVYSMAVAGIDRSRYLSADAIPFVKAPHPLGVDASIPLTSTLSLVGTLAPDFSNVDADQITIAPQVYQRNLTEYRPFFAQGANYINNAATALAVNEPANITFYSPSIGAIDQGLKLEGTYGAFQSIGLLEASGADAATGQAFHDAAFGWKHVLPQRTFGYWTNGAIANHGTLHDSTVEFGAQARDLRSGWLGAIFHESEFTQAGDDRYASSSTSGFIDHQNDRHEVLLGFRTISPRFHPADGFTQVADIRGVTAEYTRFFDRSSIDMFADRYVDATGAVHKADTGFTLARKLRADTIITLGRAQTEARSYDGDFYSGFPSYKDGVTQTFESSFVEAALRPASPSPIDLKYSWGRFGDGFLRQFATSGGRALSRQLGMSWEYDDARQSPARGKMHAQALYRISFAYSLAADSSFVFGVRSVTGDGTFSEPGTDVSGTLHHIFENGNELYVSFGSPAAPRTLKRFLVKYLLNL